MKESKEPPRWMIKFLRWFCPNQLLEEIEGDLYQKFDRDLNPDESAGKSSATMRRRANRRFFWNVLLYFRPGILSRNKIVFPFQRPLIMHHFSFALRVFTKHQIFSAINIFGLSLGIAVCLLISNYVLFEKSYDTYYSRANDIVRVNYGKFIDGELQYRKAQVYPAVGETLKAEIPVVEAFTRIFPLTTYVEAIVSTEDSGTSKQFAESSIVAVDSTFLQVFSLPLISGNRNSALTGNKKIVIAESQKQKYFGSDEAIGKTLHWQGMGDFLVTGVFEDLPENSHFKFDMITSWMNVYGERSAWNWDGFYTYLLLKPNTDKVAVRGLVQTVLDSKLNERPGADRIRSEFELQPITDIHLNSQFDGEMKATGNSTIVIALQIAAIFVLVLAMINYFNLSVARALKRAKEVAVRKVMGSSRSQLISLFLVESFLFHALAFIIGIGLFILVSPFFNSLVGKPVPTTLWMLPEKMIWFIATLFILVIIGSLYTANSIAKSGTHVFKKSLLVLQFSITIMLVTGALVIEKQVSFMQNQNVGFNLNQSLIIKTFAGPGAEMDSTFFTKLWLFKKRAKELSGVSNATITSNIPGRENDWIGRLQKSGSNSELITASRTRVDPDFIDTYELTLSAGSNFTRSALTQVLINQTASRLLGFQNDQDAIGEKVMGSFEIVGVLEDFHEQSLHRLVKPSIFTVDEGYMKFITVSVNPERISTTLDALRTDWKIIYPDTPFEYFFLNEHFNNQYQQEQQLTKIFVYFSVVGISIACLGLFGFAYYVMFQRVKEIGIRKTLGASVADLIKMLSKEMMLIVAIAGFIAAPLSYKVAAEWLVQYPIRIQFNLMIPLIAIMGVGSIAFMSIVMLLVRSVNKNPVDSLRTE